MTLKYACFVHFNTITTRLLTVSIVVGRDARALLERPRGKSTDNLLAGKQIKHQERQGGDGETRKEQCPVVLPFTEEAK